jgi:mannose/fructose/N-acetylgalactosamine-specific phosphotransferase system component IIC
MKKGFLPIVILFLLVTIACLLLRQPLKEAGVSIPVLLIGNTILFGITLLSKALTDTALEARNTQGFMRNVYGGIMLKFFLIIIVVLLYVALAKPINKPALFTCMGLYLVYLFLSTRSALTYQNPTNDANGKSRL